jgi:excinuclease ABC subunit A
MSSDRILIKGARQNNLKGLDLELPLNELIVVTGVSGSGKSSLAFDTIYAEGQRRYVETFSPYARQFLERMDKPAAERIEGIPPAIAIDQTNPVRTSRSTVGTMTELNDHLKLLYARATRLFCKGCGNEVRRDSPQSIVDTLLARAKPDTPALITFAVMVPDNFTEAEIKGYLAQQGYTRIYKHEGARLEVIQDRVRLNSENRARIFEDLEKALKHGRGKVTVYSVLNDGDKPPSPSLTPTPLPARTNIILAPSSPPLLPEGEGSEPTPASRAPRSIGEGRDAWRFSSELHCAECDIAYRDPMPNFFSFNSPIGACDTCRGFGRVIGVDYSLVIPDESKTLREGAIKPWQTPTNAICQKDMMRFAKKRGVPTDVPWRKLAQKHRRWVIEGEGSSREGKWYGVDRFFKWLEGRAYRMHVRVLLSKYRAYTPCPACRGARLKPEALLWRLGTQEDADAALAPASRFRPAESSFDDATLAALPGLTIHDLVSLPIDKVHAFFQRVHLPSPLDEATDLLLGEIRTRLTYLCEVGVGYLTLDRQSRTLSGGEVQRLNLTTALGTSLVNTLFVLDEPSIGLHARDMKRVVQVLHRLRDAGNTLLVVEHDPQVMLAADRVLDIGPGPGERGGEVVFFGTPEELRHAKNSLTAQYLSGMKRIDSHRHPRESGGPGKKTWIPASAGMTSNFIDVLGGAENNLKNVDVRIPLNRLVCVTGVSGSGKSTLIQDVLYNALRKLKGRPKDTAGRHREIRGHEQIRDVMLVDQSPIGKTTRSNPASYVGAWDAIRKLYAAEPASHERGYTASTFSFNTGLGRCPTCTGSGFEHVEMQFLSDIYIRCPDCDGRRFRAEVLEVKLLSKRQTQPKSIADVLDMTVSEAAAFFGDQRDVLRGLEPLTAVGLSYVKLGQPVPTLSGGEAQRLKLAGHLCEAKDRNKENSATLFLFDEPTTGLHFDDIATLLKAFQRLLDEGHSVVVIEHNLDVIQASDWIIDLGPEGGDAGGEIVCAGTPEQVAKHRISHTGKALRDYRKDTHQPVANHIDRISEPTPPLPPGEGRGEGERAGLTHPSPSSIPAGAREHHSHPLDGANVHRTFATAPSRLPGEEGSEPSALRANNMIRVHHAREHNLKNIEARIPRERFTVITGVSGSGKSTLAFDILFNEGQRRYLESLNAYARSLVQPASRPDVDAIFGLPPTVAIEQRTSRGGRKSTVATLTEIYHFLRLLFVKLGTQHCPDCDIPIESQSADAIVARVMRDNRGQTIQVLAPLVTARKGYYTDLAKWALTKGVEFLRVDGTATPTKNWPRLARFKEHDIELPVGNVAVIPKNEKAMRALIERALDLGKGVVQISPSPQPSPPKGRGRKKNDDHRVNSLSPDHGGEGRGEGATVFSTKRACPKCGRGFPALDPRLFSYNSKHGWCERCYGTGLLMSGFDAEQTGEEIWWNDWWEGAARVCPDCEGTRLNPTALAVRFENRSIAQFAALPVDAAQTFFQRLKLRGRAAEIARDILPELASRLAFLKQVGLGYLSLDRSAPTLSGGEAQRIRLAAQLGSNLRGVCYILDEPTIGLHHRDNLRLLDTLAALEEKGNTVVVVEHDEETIRRAQHVIDLGPGAGKNGGRIVAEGNIDDIMNAQESVTGRCLAQPMRHPLMPRRPWRKGDAAIEIDGAAMHNLREVDVAIPLRRLVGVTGVSGSGKSTLVRHVLHDNMRRLVNGRPSKKLKLNAQNMRLDGCAALRGWDELKHVLEVDQTPIGKTPRSCPATYVGFWDSIRRLYADVPEARLRGYGPARFSFNVSGGRCEVCEGQGAKTIEMSFLPDVTVPCEACAGARFNTETLAVRYRDKTIADVLAMNVDEAVQFFAVHKRIHHALQLLQDVGLGYLTLGQPSPTLSGGEAQRIKLVTELAKAKADPREEYAVLRGGAKPAAAKGVLYVLDEPTIGLHMADVEKLIRVLHRLVAAGNTVVIIEHNLDVIAEADWIIDLGPEGGAGGGRIVACGTPEMVAAHKDSHTARALKEFLARQGESESSAVLA